MERWPVERIHPYPRNARLHSPEQIDLIAASIEKYGFTAPLLVDEHGVVIYGHGRLAGALKLGLTDVPVCVAEGWSEDDKAAYRIADNQIALRSEWDLPLLKDEITELSQLDYDLDILGFTNVQLNELSIELPSPDGDATPAESPERELGGAEKKLMVKAWQNLTREWLAILTAQGTLSTNFTPAALAAHFLRARFYGVSIPSAATLAYTPHRTLISGDVFSLVDGLKRALSNENNVIERLWFILGQQPRLDKLLSGTLPFLGCRLPTDFPSDLAQSLYDEFVTDPGGAVLDPCHGWGGRMLGAMLSRNVTLYDGFDVDERTSKGVRLMFDDLAPFIDGERTVRVQTVPFEDAELGRGVYDFALTSPPYYDTEKYGGELSSWRRYPTFDNWAAGFYLPLIAKTQAALKPKAVFALQVGSQTYPLADVAREASSDLGFDYIETRQTDMSKHGYVGRGSDGAVERDRDDHEVIVILRKKKPRPVKGAAHSSTSVTFST